MQEKNILSDVEEIKSLIYQRHRFIEQNEAIPQELDNRLKALFSGQGVDRSVSFIKMTEAQMGWLEGEIEGLKVLKSRYEKAIDDMKALVLNVMQENGLTKIEGERGHSFSLRRNESVKINDLTKVPSKFTRQKVLIEADKVAIKAMIKGGENVEGAELTESYSVTVK